MSTYATSHLLGQVLSTACPSREILEHLSSKWSLLVLHCLSEGVHRFSELKVKIEGISEKMLSQTLKTMEQDGLVLRTVYPIVPPKVEYQLTILGSQAATKVNELISWIERNIPEILANKPKINL
ncbi:winged helix-turn-helix transcriptional regulator [Acinetobacter kanungonis]|uniref:winged helix-turn-helix transcriptional regulator n=1 Tax=Acinetobacter kanungonis TaxID=2699469 RepID=UPI00137B345B|nr:helix-turn-helix domain-containing protein [Acinetobacter kanungonis]NCI78614.1 helix-turn-helix transcriptional regulator [Acinetobacter kanungonis]